MSIYRFQNPSRVSCTHVRHVHSHSNISSFSKPSHTLSQVSSQISTNSNPSHPYLQQTRQHFSRYLNIGGVKNIANNYYNGNRINVNQCHTRNLSSIHSNHFKFDLQTINNIKNSNTSNLAKHSLFNSQQRHIRYTAPNENPDYSKQNPHSHYGEVNNFQKGLLHLSKKTSYADFVLYIICVWTTFFGAAYLASPLYRLLCQTFGWGGEITRRIDNRLQSLADWRTENGHKSSKNRKFMVRFDARTGPGMPWEFEPVQDYVVTRAGESTLAFFTAENTSINPMTGLSIYTVLPFKAAPYFIKIQCFCFEEQRLRGKEILDMPVLFFIDPLILEDQQLRDIDEITLSYIFYPVEDDQSQVEPDDDDDEFWDNDYDDDDDDGDIIVNNNSNGNTDKEIMPIPVEVINVPVGGSIELPDGTQLRPQI